MSGVPPDPPTGSLPAPLSGRALGTPARDLAAAAALQPSHVRAPRLERVVCLAHTAGLLAAAGGRVCCTWSLQSEAPVGRIVVDAPIVALGLARGAGAVALASGCEVAVFELHEGRGGACRFRFAHEAEVTSVHTEGTILASADASGRVLLHDLATGRRRLELQHAAGRPLLRFHGSRFLTVDTGERHWLVDARCGLPLVEGADAMHALRIVVHRGARLRWLDGLGDELDAQVVDGPICSIDVDVQRRRVLAATSGAALHLFDLDTAQPLGHHESFTTPVHGACFDGEGGLLVAGGEALVQRLVDGRAVRAFYDQARPLVAMALHAGRRELFVSDRDGGLGRIDLDSGRLDRPYRGPTGSVSAVLGTHGWVASGAYDGTLRVWHHGRLGPTAVYLQEGPVQAIAAGRDGRSVWAGTWAGRVHAIELEHDAPIATIDCEASSIRTLAFDAEHRRLAVGATDGELRLIELRGGVGHIVRRARQTGCAYLARWDGSGNLLVTDQHGVRVYRGSDLEPIGRCRVDGDDVRWFDCWGERLVVLTLGGVLALHDAATFAPLARRRIEAGHNHRSVVVLGPNRIATASADGLVRVFDAKLEPVATLEVLRDGWLWLTPPRGPQPGWLHTDRPELIEVGQGDGAAWQPWPFDDPRRARHLATRTSPSHVMQAVNDVADATRAGLQVLPDGRGFAPGTHRLGGPG